MKKKYMFPVVVGVALLGYYFFVYKKSQVITPELPIEDPKTNLQDSILDNTITVTAPPVNTAPAIQYMDLFASIPGLGVMTQSGLVSYLTPLIKAVYGYKSINISNYTLTRLQLMFGIASYIPFSNTQYWKAFNSMTERELGDTWNYVSSYLGKNKKLLFAENPTLYNEISSIQTKYGIF